MIILLLGILVLISCVTGPKHEFKLRNPVFEIEKYDRDCHYVVVFLELKFDNPLYETEIEIQENTDSLWEPQINTDRDIVTYPVAYTDTARFRIRYHWKGLYSDWAYSERRSSK